MVLRNYPQGTSFDVTTWPNHRYPQRASSGPVFLTTPHKPLVDNCPEPRERCDPLHRVPLGVGWGALAPTTPLPRAAWHRWARTRHPWQPPPPRGSQGVSQPTLAGSGPRQHPSATIFSRCAGCRRGYSLLDGNSCTMHCHMPTWPVMSFRAKFLLSPIFFSSSLVVLEGATASIPPKRCKNKCPHPPFAQYPSRV